MEDQDLGPLVYEVDGPIARIVLNDPGRANSQTSEMVHAFDDALTLADRDYAVKVVVIKANGKGFCAGHAAGGGETMIEPWVFMNWKRTYEYLYTAQTVTAAEALEVGMVNRVVGRDDLESTVEELAADVARAPLSTLMATKQLVKRAWELMGMRMHLQMSTDVMAVTATTSDAMAVRAAMAERGLRPRQHAAGDGDA